MHISEQVETELLNDGWTSVTGGAYVKKIAGFAEAGEMSSGDRLVTLTICERGRYLSRVDGWGWVDKDVDLRNYESAKGAIREVLAHD